VNYFVHNNKALPEGPPQGVGSTPLVTYTNAQLEHTVIGYYTRYSMKRMEKMFIERGLENESESRLMDSDRPFFLQENKLGYSAHKM